MILLSAGGKGLIKIKSWQEIVERPGYEAEIDPEKTKLFDILGEYSLESKPKCGLKNCSTPHIRGYLVVCTDGSETNIGNICGKKIFGVDFDEAKSRFVRDLNEKSWRESLGVFRNQMRPIESRIEFLRTGERQGEWCYKELQFHAERAYESSVLERLIYRAKINDGKLMRINRLTDREQELMQSSGQRAHFTESEVGVINGITALRDYKKLRKLLSVDLGADLLAFKILDETQLDASELKRWSRWAKNVEKVIKQVEEIIQEAIRFLLPSNVKLIQNNKHLI